MIDPAKPITEERIERSMRTLAQIMLVHGNAAMPLFERLGTELQRLRMHREMLMRVLGEAQTVDVVPAPARIAK